MKREREKKRGKERKKDSEKKRQREKICVFVLRERKRENLREKYVYM